MGRVMRFQRQGDFECVPTSIAMLRDIPKDELIRAVMPHNANNWNELAHKYPFLWWDTVKLMADATLGEGMGIVLFGAAHRPKRPFPSNPPPGRGLMFISSPIEHHCVAYENGIVYDPILDKPKTYRSWLAERSRFRLVGHVQVKHDNISG